MSSDVAEKRIWEFEFLNNGFGNLSGYDVEVHNLRKVSKSIWYADIVIVEYGVKREEYIDCEYDLSKIKPVFAHW